MCFVHLGCVLDLFCVGASVHSVVKYRVSKYYSLTGLFFHCFLYCCCVPVVLPIRKTPPPPFCEIQPLRCLVVLQLSSDSGKFVLKKTIWINLLKRVAKCFLDLGWRCISCFLIKVYTYYLSDDIKQEYLYTLENFCVIYFFYHSMNFKFVVCTCFKHLYLLVND